MGVSDFEVETRAHLLRRDAVDGFDLEQAVMPLGFARRAHVADHQVAAAQVVAAQLGLRNVYIFLAHLVIGAQKTDPLAHNLEHAAAHFQPLFFGFRLADADQQIFFFQTSGVWDF